MTLGTDALQKVEAHARTFCRFLVLEGREVCLSLVMAFLLFIPREGRKTVQPFPICTYMHGETLTLIGGLLARTILTHKISSEHSRRRW